MLKSARAFNATRHARDGKVRDAVRERDAAAINEAVLTIVADGSAKMELVRKGELAISLESLTEVVDWGIRTFGSYVGESLRFFFRLPRIEFLHFRLDRHQPNRDSYNNSPPFPANCRSFPSYSISHVCSFPPYDLERLERAWRQIAALQGAIPWRGFSRFRRKDTAGTNCSR